MNANYTGSGLYEITYIPQLGDITGTATEGEGVRSAGHTYSTRTINDTVYYRVEIEPGATYNTVDKTVVTAIFNRADRLPINAAADSVIVTGEVYRGTQSVTDYSDANSYETFEANCIKKAEENTNASVTTNNPGWWLKIIDNDNDGYTDWVFQTRYTVARVTAVNADTGVLTLDTAVNANGTWSDADDVNYGATSARPYAGETIEVGDVVYYATIDGVSRAWKCEVVEGRVSSINRNARTVTIEGNDTPYNESAVHEHSSSTDIASYVRNMSGTVRMNLYLDKFGNLAAFSQNIAGNFVLLTDGWARNVINGTEYAVTAWDRDAQKLAQYNVTSGGNLFIRNNNSANSWNRISEFEGLNNGGFTYTSNAAVAGYPTVADSVVASGTDEVHTMVAYMETDGENATLTPVDTIYDVERQNGREIRMIDMNRVVPLSTNNNGVCWTTTTAAYQPYDTPDTAADTTGSGRHLAVTTRVRALSNTTYYFVYRTTWNANDPANLDSLGASVYVHEVTGYSAANAFMTANGISSTSYIEDVYVVGTRAVDTVDEYYTANVVVVELNDTFYAANRNVEEVFIYDFPITSNYSTIETVSAIRQDGSDDKDLKIDMGISRRYTEAENKVYDTGLSNSAIFQPGLYWLHRSSRTNGEDIWYVTPMTHEEIRSSGHYDVGQVETNDGTYPNDYVQVTDYICGTAGVHTEPAHYNPATGAGSSPVASTVPNGTRRNAADVSNFYTLSYASSGSTYRSNLTATNMGTCLREESKIDDDVDAGRNQVLVRFNSQNQIVYAVSFAHGSSSSENYAQQVWRRSLLSAAKPDTATRIIEISEEGAAQLLSLTTSNTTKLKDAVESITINWSANTSDPVVMTKIDLNNDDIKFRAEVERVAIYTITVTWKTGYETCVLTGLENRVVASDANNGTAESGAKTSAYTLTFVDGAAVKDVRLQVAANSIQYDPDVILITRAKEDAKTDLDNYVKGFVNEDWYKNSPNKAEIDAAIKAAVAAQKAIIDAKETSEEVTAALTAAMTAVEDAAKAAAAAAIKLPDASKSGVTLTPKAQTPEDEANRQQRAVLGLTGDAAKPDGNNQVTEQVMSATKPVWDADGEGNTGNVLRVDIEEATGRALSGTVTLKTWNIIITLKTGSTGDVAVELIIAETVPAGTATVDLSGTGLTISPKTVEVNKPIPELTLAITSNAFALPENGTGMTITMNGAPVDSTYWTYDGETGKITFVGGYNATGNIVVTANGTAQAPVEISAAEAAVGYTAVAATGSYYVNDAMPEITITPANNWKLVAGGTVSVTNNGEAVAAEKVTYDAATGKITFAEDVKIAGNVVVTGTDVVSAEMICTGLTDETLATAIGVDPSKVVIDTENKTVRYEVSKAALEAKMDDEDFDWSSYVNAEVNTAQNAYVMYLGWGFAVPEEVKAVKCDISASKDPTSPSLYQDPQQFTSGLITEWFSFGSGKLEEDGSANFDTQNGGTRTGVTIGEYTRYYTVLFSSNASASDWENDADLGSDQWAITRVVVA